MSTFDGIVQEFPYIQIDYFRKNPDRPPPLACFLSHVHSDHLQGLESFRAPFIYCSPATRELLLRIEKYPHRMNFNKGILESRRLHYKHLYKLLRPIPLNTPTEIELTPLLSIRVTLLDANHCTGAVMFLIEGDGKAILYTGDVRAEPWWVNSLIRHPVLIPYTTGSKRLERLYLDTTFARTSNIYREFPSKADGLAELLRKVELYPDDTVFYFRAWTFGYEDVWLALSAALNVNVHVDRYQMGLYKSLSEHARGTVGEGSGLCGFKLGNGFVPGCLSNDEKSRVHSCEPGTPCATLKSESDKTVYIRPIINRMVDGVEVLEEGAGGGGGDLYQLHELELPDQSAMEELEKLCFECVRDSQTLSRIRQALAKAWRSKNKTLSLDSYGKKDDSDIPLETLVSILGRGQFGSRPNGGDSAAVRSTPDQLIPRTIHFPYSRHSSYIELRNLVSVFKPNDIYACTADALDWTEDMSMETLFGDLCSGNRFTHDAYMRTMQEANDLGPKKRARHDGEISPQSTQQCSLVDGDQAAATLTDSCPSIRESDAPAGLTVSSQKRPPFPSSLETDHGEDHNTASSPLQIPKLTPTAEHTKRSNIRQAWKYLRTDAEGTESAFRVGSLPSSFRTHEDASTKNDSQQQGLTSHHKHPNTTASQTTRSSTTVPALAFQQCEGEKDTEGGDTQTLSLESQSHDTEDYHTITTTTNEPQPPALPSSSAPSLPQNPHHPPPLDRSGSSSRLRREAYLAAKADSYDAWSLVGLLSTGNNHTEEEIEL